MPPSIPEIIAQLRVKSDHADRRIGGLEEDLDQMRAAVARTEAAVHRCEVATRDVPKLVQDMADLHLARAHEAGAAALRKVLASGAVAVFGAVLTLMGQYVLARATQPDPGPPVQTLSEDAARAREQWRLLEQREGYRMGQGAPAPTPTYEPPRAPPSAPAVTQP